MACTKDDHKKHVELLIQDYLRQERCIQTFDAVTNYFCHSPTTKTSRSSPQASSAFSLEKRRLKEEVHDRSSVLSHLIHQARNNNNAKVKTKMMSWSAEELERLEELASATQKLDKSTRWKTIAQALGRRKRDCYDQYKVQLLMVQPPKHEKLLVDDESPSSHTRHECLIVEECDNLEMNDLELPEVPSSSSSSSSSKKQTQWNPQSLTPVALRALRQLLFGDPLKNFHPDWLEQGFQFQDQNEDDKLSPSLAYGLVQTKGGPCGVLAVVQAYVLHAWLYLDLSLTQALVEAWVQILWHGIGRREGCCTIVVSSSETTKGRGGKGTSWSQIRAANETEVRAILTDYAGDWTTSGVVLLTLSAILSRGLDNVSRDWDNHGHTPTLIGAHHYCTQELVNLLLSGRATSNVFDGSKTLDDSQVTLRGVASRQTVGFLSLFEAYDYLQVGQHLKTPQFPIWVICSESHYSVLFEQLPQEQKKKDVVTLSYYDGLARQQEPIDLTISEFDFTDDHHLPNANQSAKNHDLIPPLNLVIQTKWKHAKVQWNGTEPIL